MFGIGGSELVVIVLVALLVFGPGRIPEVMRTITAAYRELTKLKRQVGDTVSELRQEIDLKAGLENEITQALRPPTGARVAAKDSKPQPSASPAVPPASTAVPAATSANAPAAAQEITDAEVAKADTDDYLAPAAAAAADNAADDYLNEGRHE